MEQTPFRYGCVVEGEFFCPRLEQEKELGRMIVSGQNVVVQGERRMGKTSLVCETIRKIKGIQLLYIDLLGVSSPADFCHKVTAAVLALNKRRSFLDKTAELLKRLRPTLTMDTLTGSPTLSLDLQATQAAQSIEDVMDMLAVHAKAEHLCVVMDEFQDMLKLDNANSILAMMRGKIQFQRDIPYVFLGSVRNSMSDIFANSRSPFYKSAALFDLAEIDEDTLCAFLVRRFKKGNRQVSAQMLRMVIQIANGVLGDIQELCDALWATTGDKAEIGPGAIEDALKLVFARESKSYIPILGQLTAIQRRVLIGMARQPDARPMSMDFMRAVNVPNAGSVRKALLRLVNLDVMYVYKDRYRLTNPFFGAWIVRL